MHINCCALPDNVTFREIQFCETQRKYIRSLQCCHTSITRPRSPATIMSAQQSVWTNIKEISELKFLALCGGDPPVTGGFPHKGTVTRKTLPYHDITKLSLLFLDIPEDDIADTLKSSPGSAARIVILIRDIVRSQDFCVVADTCTIKAESNHATPAFILLIAKYYVLNLEGPKVYSQLLG